MLFTLTFTSDKILLSVIVWVVSYTDWNFNLIHICFGVEFMMAYGFFFNSQITNFSNGKIADWWDEHLNRWHWCLYVYGCAVYAYVCVSTWPNWLAKPLCYQPIHLFVHPCILFICPFWKWMEQFWCKLAQVVCRTRAWNSQLWESRDKSTSLGTEIEVTKVPFCEMSVAVSDVF